MIFPEFLDALQGFAGGNTSWNAGAVRLYGSQVQFCFVLNFVLPTETRPGGNRRTYVSVSALVYSFVESFDHDRPPFVLVISDTNALCRILSDAVDWVGSQYQRLLVPMHMAIQIYLAHISTKGFSGILLELEREVSVFCGRSSGD